MEAPSDGPWRRGGRDGYELVGRDYRARLTLRSGPAGLRWLEAGGCFLPGPLLATCHWLAQGVDPRPAPARGGRWDHWCRGHEVVAHFEEGPANPMRFECRWKLAAFGQLELDVSVTTSLVPALRSFELFCVGQAPAAELLVPIGEGHAVRWLSFHSWARRWATLTRDDESLALLRDGRWPAAARAAIAGPYAFPAVVYRPSDANWSYVEVGHPLDVVRVILQHRGARLRWYFSLFGLDLEKGVILRSRLRAAVVPRTDDLKKAEEICQQLRASPPPLSA